VTDPVRPGATAIYVAYGTRSLDLEWIPDAAPVVVVHNDRELDSSAIVRPHVTHVRNDSNVGFGAAVNVGLEHASSARVVICNPDTALGRAHWDALACGGPDEVVTVPLIEPDGTPTSVVNRYPTPVTLVATGYRAGRLLPRGSRARSATTALLGRWGRTHSQLLKGRAGSFGMRDHWVSGAVFSVDAGRLRAVGGFRPEYFLYMEDVDLCRRLALEFPTMRITVAPVPPGRHAVGGSARAPGARRAADTRYLASIRQYAAERAGLRWRLAAAALVPRRWWLQRS
jgi:GT2 family glycosyltransferase